MSWHPSAATPPPAPPPAPRITPFRRVRDARKGGWAEHTHTLCPATTGAHCSRLPSQHHKYASGHLLWQRKGGGNDPGDLQGQELPECKGLARAMAARAQAGPGSGLASNLILAVPRPVCPTPQHSDASRHLRDGSRGEHVAPASEMGTAPGTVLLRHPTAEQVLCHTVAINEHEIAKRWAPGSGKDGPSCLHAAVGHSVIRGAVTQGKWDRKHKG